ncbi:MAG: hypothetical protein ABDH66_08875 [Bacteroidia bacterium]
MRVWIFALFIYPRLAQSLLQTADSLLKQRKYATPLTLYDSLLRTQPMPNTLYLRVYLKGAEAWEGVNKPTDTLQWIGPR